MTDIQRAMLGDHDAAARMTEQGALLPCPFCGKSGRLTHNGLNKRQNNAPSSAGDFCTTWTAECTWCSCKRGEGRTEFVFSKNGELSILGDDGKKKAALAWNTRAPLLTPEQMERLEEVE